MTGLEAFQTVLATPEPPELGPGPRAGVQKASALNRTLDDIFQRTGLAPEKQPLARALLLLWHDQLETAHEIVQDAADSDGAFIHGIVHRREPDYGNAKYWFQRVGRHAAFPEIARGVNELFRGHETSEIRSEIIPDGHWDPFAFIDACEKWARKPLVDADYQLLRDAQRVEMETLLRFLVSA